MVRLWIALLLAALAIGLCVANVRAQARAAGGSPSFPGLHLAALLVILVLAMLPIAPITSVYKGVIVFALLVLFLREALYWIPGSPRAIYAGPSFFVWFLLWLAFAVTVGRGLWQWSGLLVLAPALLLVWPVLRLRKSSPGLWLTLSLYALQPALALGFGIVLLVQQAAIWSLLGAAGLLALAIVDLLIARDLLGKPVRALPLDHQLLTQAGAFLLALSIWGSSLLTFPQAFGL